MHPEVVAVETGTPADEAGLQPRDVVLAAGGERDVSHTRLIEMIKANEGKPLPLEIERDGQISQMIVTPRKIRDTVMHRRAAHAVRAAHRQPGCVRSVQVERRAELGVGAS